MGLKDKRVNDYINDSTDSAQPILLHLRELVHNAHPEIEEDIKWGMPHFMYKGIVCNMASFKNHCVFGFKNYDLMADSLGLFKQTKSKAMGQLGRITSLDDLPADNMLILYIKEAISINEKERVPAGKSGDYLKKELEIPGYFMEVLNQNKIALSNFQAFSYSHQKEYVEWIIEAKREDTRKKRMATALEWLAEGKSKNWKYTKK